MKSLIAERAKRNNAKIQENAKENKRLISKQKNNFKKEQPKTVVSSEVEVAKEPKTIMLDVN